MPKRRAITTASVAHRRAGNVGHLLGQRPAQHGVRRGQRLLQAGSKTACPAELQALAQRQAEQAHLALHDRQPQALGADTAQLVDLPNPSKLRLCSEGVDEMNGTRAGAAKGAGVGALRSPGFRLGKRRNAPQRP